MTKRQGHVARAGALWGALGCAVLVALAAAAACSSSSSSPSSCSKPGGCAGQGGVAGAEQAAGVAGEAAAGGTSQLAGAAGEVGERAAGGSGGVAEEPDVQAPTVISVEPEIGAIGVASDAQIEITFSEPMNKVTTQVAFQSANLGDVGFDWPSDDVLRITPNAPLVYATGATLAVTAKKYGFSVTGVAEDLAGNALQQPLTSEFSTLRELSVTVGRADKFYEYDDGTVRTLYHPTLTQGALVGDAYNTGFDNNEWLRALIAFDISELPIGIESFVSAELVVSTCCVVGNPAGLGGIHVDHLQLETVTIAMTDATPLASLGLLTPDPAPGSKKLDVAVALEDDYAERIARHNRAQFRFQFEPATDDDELSDSVELDQAAEGAGAAHIDVTFQIP